MWFLKMVLTILALSLLCKEGFGISDEFRAYVNTYGKVYTTQDELNKRFMIWTENKEIIELHNHEASLGQHTYTMAINEFTDLTIEEFRRTMLTKFNLRSGQQQPSWDEETIRSIRHLPDTVDWRAKSYVTEVGNQGQCGSCWAFTATGALEGQHKKATGILVDLSEQNLMDCSAKQGNYGCEGGSMDASFTYVKENNGIDMERSYSYNLTNPGTYKCRYTVSHRGATCSGFVDLQKGNETALQMAVALVGPIAVAVDASHTGFMYYTSGVYNNPTDCSTTSLGHSLLITGYGVENGTEYWECKNSWGPTWGNHGYIRMSRNRDNQCGIATMASYPTV